MSSKLLSWLSPQTSSNLLLVCCHCFHLDAHRRHSSLSCCLTSTCTTVHGYWVSRRRCFCQLVPPPHGHRLPRLEPQVRSKHLLVQENVLLFNGARFSLMLQNGSIVVAWFEWSIGLLSRLFIPIASVGMKPQHSVRIAGAARPSPHYYHYLALGFLCRKRIARICASSCGHDFVKALV